jgi:hypothetical protein
LPARFEERRAWTRGASGDGGLTMSVSTTTPQKLMMVERNSDTAATSLREREKFPLACYESVPQAFFDVYAGAATDTPPLGKESGGAPPGFHCFLRGVSAFYRKE